MARRVAICLSILGPPRGRCLSVKFQTGGGMIDRENRQLIMHELGGTIDELVRDLYSDTIDGPSMVQEPEITSRICQRVEDRLDGQRVGDYILRVTAQSMPDRGPLSLEKITG